MQDALLHQLLGARAVQDLLVQAVDAHVFLEAHLLALDGGSGGREREDVAWAGREG